MWVLPCGLCSSCVHSHTGLACFQERSPGNSGLVVALKPGPRDGFRVCTDAFERMRNLSDAIAARVEPGFHPGFWLLPRPGLPDPKQCMVTATASMEGLAILLKLLGLTMTAHLPAAAVPLGLDIGHTTKRENLQSTRPSWSLTRPRTTSTMGQSCGERHQGAQEV